jgi:NitT/TauT family transport system substrate-binding protein
MDLDKLGKFLIAASLLAGAGCSRDRPVVLGIAAQQSPSQILPYLAVELGHFRDAGLEVRMEEFAGSGRAMQALLGGSLDVLSGYHEQVLALEESAPPVQTFFVLTNSGLVALIASPAAQRKVEGVADLRGANVGVTTLGSSTHLFLNYMLRRHGLDSGDVQPIAIGTAARALAAMERGSVDAGVVSDFTARSLAKRAKLRVLADTRTPETVRQTYGLDRYPGAAVFAKREWIESHRAQVAKLTAALRRTREWVLSRPVEEVVAAIPKSHHGDDAALYREVVRGAVALLSRDGRVDPDGARLAAELVRSKRKVEEAHTNAFVE